MNKKEDKTSRKPTASSIFMPDFMRPQVEAHKREQKKRQRTSKQLRESIPFSDVKFEHSSSAKVVQEDVSRPETMRPESIEQAELEPLTAMTKGKTPPVMSPSDAERLVRKQQNHMTVAEREEFYKMVAMFISYHPDANDNRIIDHLRSVGYTIGKNALSHNSKLGRFVADCRKQKPTSVHTKSGMLDINGEFQGND